MLPGGFLAGTSCTSLEGAAIFLFLQNTHTHVWGTERRNQSITENNEEKRSTDATDLADRDKKTGWPDLIDLKTCV